MDNLHFQPQDEGPSNSTVSQPSTSYRGEGSRRSAPGEEPGESSGNLNREGSPPTLDAAEPLHIRQRETQADVRLETTQDIRPSTSNAHTGSQSHIPHSSLKRKLPHSTEEQEHPHHNAQPERGRKIVSRCKRKCRRAHRTPLPTTRTWMSYLTKN
jgi:hypothetical protein